MVDERITKKKVKIKRIQDSINLYSKRIASEQIDIEELRNDIDAMRVQLELKRSGYEEQVKELQIERAFANTELRETEELVNTYTKQIMAVQEYISK